ncbi:hypothetical protein SOPP22_03770 [Shewanella sp. OPT22]|nr:hypothetical protein SOPP22_03770 [Shewanella sp. OPT22]
MSESLNCICNINPHYANEFQFSRGDIHHIAIKLRSSTEDAGFPQFESVTFKNTSSNFAVSFNVAVSINDGILSFHAEPLNLPENMSFSQSNKAKNLWASFNNAAPSLEKKLNSSRRQQLKLRQEKLDQTVTLHTKELKELNVRHKQSLRESHQKEYLSIHSEAFPAVIESVHHFNQALKSYQSAYEAALGIPNLPEDTKQRLSYHLNFLKMSDITDLQQFDSECIQNNLAQLKSLLTQVTRVNVLPEKDEFLLHESLQPSVTHLTDSLTTLKSTLEAIKPTTDEHTHISIGKDITRILGFLSEY